jgi:hypothetical protein
MNYQYIYQSLVDYRKQNIPEGYKEKHHIVPKCMGGTNEKENLVKLTAREHFIAHQLLAKNYYNDYKLIHAVFRMSNSKQYGSRKYAWVRELQSKAMSEIMIGNQQAKGNIPSKESKRKMSESAKEKIISEETKRKISKTLKNKHLTKEHKENISKGQIGKKKIPHTEETKLKISESLKGKISPMKDKHHTEESKQKMSDSRLGKKRGSYKRIKYANSNSM